MVPHLMFCLKIQSCACCSSVVELQPVVVVLFNCRNMMKVVYTFLWVPWRWIITFVCSLCFEIVVIMKTGGWWYKDRLGRSRGPCELITLKTAYGAGIIDRDTFIWGEDMDEWAPIHMVYGLEPAIATWEGLYMG